MQRDRPTFAVLAVVIVVIVVVVGGDERVSVCAALEGKAQAESVAVDTVPSLPSPLKFSHVRLLLLGAGHGFASKRVLPDPFSSPASRPTFDSR